MILRHILGEMQRIAFRLMLSSCVCVCVCVYLSVSVCVYAAFVRYRRRFLKLLGMTPDITCKSFTQIGLQIRRWRIKWRP